MDSVFEATWLARGQIAWTSAGRVSRDLQEQNWEVERIYGEVRMFGEVTEQSEVLRRGGQVTVEGG